MSTNAASTPASTQAESNTSLAARGFQNGSNTSFSTAPLTNVTEKNGVGTATNPPPQTPIPIPIKIGDWTLPGILAAVLAFLAAKYWFSKNKKEKQIESLTTDTDKLVEECIDYWTKPVNPSNRIAQRGAEQKIKAHIKSIAHRLREIAKRPTTQSQMNELAADLDRASTGGDFESARRNADKTRCEMISLAAEKLKAALRKYS